MSCRSMSPTAATAGVSRTAPTEAAASSDAKPLAPTAHQEPPGRAATSWSVTFVSPPPEQEQEQETEPARAPRAKKEQTNTPRNKPEGGTMEPTTLREQTTAAEPPPEPRSPAAPAKHPRERIQDFLADEPGASITRIAAHLGMTQQNTRRHLDYLAKDSRVRNEHVGRTKHYYLSNQTALHICLHPYLSVPALHRIAKTLIDDPSRHWTTNKLSKAAGSTFAPTKRFLAILEQKGLLESPGSEKNRQVHATDRLVAVCRAHKKRFGSPRRRSRGGNARRCGS